jgi:hypothetical protein
VIYDKTIMCKKSKGSKNRIDIEIRLHAGSVKNLLEKGLHTGRRELLHKKLYGKIVVAPSIYLQGTFASCLYYL